MKKLTILLLIACIISFSFINVSNVNIKGETTGARIEVFVLDNQSMSSYPIIALPSNKLNLVNSVNGITIRHNTNLIVSNAKEELPKYDITLDIKIQEYMFEQSQDHNLSYEYLLAIAYCESSFNPSATNDKNKNGTTDSGLMQINSAMSKRISKELGRNIDRKNPIDSIDAAIWLFNYLREKFAYLELSQEEESFFITLAYNMGESNAINFIKKNGFSGSSYVNKVFKCKEIIESTGGIKD